MLMVYLLPVFAIQGDAKGARVKILEHVADVRSLAETVLPGRRPVYVSHRYSLVSICRVGLPLFFVVIIG